MNLVQPCPHCQRIPEPLSPMWPMTVWTIYCPCVKLDSLSIDEAISLLKDDEAGEGTIGDSEEDVIERWNELVEDIILGKAG